MLGSPKRESPITLMLQCSASLLVGWSAGVDTSVSRTGMVSLYYKLLLFFCIRFSDTYNTSVYKYLGCHVTKTIKTSTVLNTDLKIQNHVWLPFNRGDLA